MEIKKANLVSREDMEGLAKSLSDSITTLESCSIAIKSEKVINALWGLKRLRDNIEANLKEVI